MTSVVLADDHVLNVNTAVMCVRRQVGRTKEADETHSAASGLLISWVFSTMHTMSLSNGSRGYM